MYIDVLHISTCLAWISASSSDLEERHWELAGSLDLAHRKMFPQKEKNHDSLEPQTTIKKWMFGETTISYVKIGNHPIETAIYKWLFGVPGLNQVFFL